jgi:hypothetical protein
MVEQIVDARGSHIDRDNIMNDDDRSQLLLPALPAPPSSVSSRFNICAHTTTTTARRTGSDRQETGRGTADRRLLCDAVEPCRRRRPQPACHHSTFPPPSLSHSLVHSLSRRSRPPVQSQCRRDVFFPSSTFAAGINPVQSRTLLYRPLSLFSLVGNSLLYSENGHESLK